MTPEQRIDFSVGTAQQIWREEAAFTADGWPAAFLNGWRQDAWLNIDVQETDAQSKLLTLTHGGLYSTFKTRFEARCVDKSWSLSNMGPEWRWYTPSPSKLPNQDGDLTPELAKALAYDVISSYGTTGMRVSATTPELERGRQKAILTSSGSELAPTNFPGTSKQIRVTPEAPDRVVGEWLTDTGAPTGEKVLFQRQAGLWKVADHTEHGQWPGPPEVFKSRPFSFDLDLLRFPLGLTKEQLNRLFPLSGYPNPYPQTVVVRKISTVFGPDGKMTKVVANSGGTSRGLMIGDPVSAVYTLYGLPTRRESCCLIYTTDAVPEEFRVWVSTHSGVERVDALERVRVK